MVMDELIANYHFREFGEDLNYCYDHGLMYQRDMSKIVSYDEKYFDNYVNREGTEIAVKLNAARAKLAEIYCDCIVDVGVGSGEFIKNYHGKAFGYDINPSGVDWLKARGLYVDIYDSFPEEVEGFTLWDTLEHIPNPQALFRLIRRNMYLFLSLPIFDDMENVRLSKHYKPNEHLYYFSSAGLIRFMKDSGFLLVEQNDEETKAGREGIGSFVFFKE
jgi:hypothetical protein